jgi:hypothetical protein
MNRRHATPLVLLLGLLAGCTQYYRNIRYPEYANSEFHKDSYECQQKSTYRLSTLSESPDKYVQVDLDAVRQCLMERGWRRAD